MTDEAIAALYDHLPPPGEVTDDALLEGFLDYAAERGLTLYPAQEEAILELFEGHNVILNTPTGSGKSLVALAVHFMALAEGRRAFYTAPIKALVSEKFFDLCRSLGPDRVGMMTGDATVNRDAPIICCTAEVLSNLALREGDRADVDYVVIDEFHYYSDRDRGVAWQVPLLELPQARFLLMSATLGDTSVFERELAERTGAPARLVRSDERPVPLDFEYRETPLHETIADLLEAGKTPVYVVHFTQRSAVEHAQDLMSVDFLSKDQKHAIARELYGFRFDTLFGKDLSRYLKHGVGVHHAGLLPKYRRLVERLAQRGHLRLICGTDTLGVGVNVPIRTVLFTKLCKYDGEKTRVLTVRDFKQIAGRAGRKGFDERGSVVAQAPEHIIENRVAQQKAEGDPKRMRKLRLKKPPERGYAHWDAETFERLQTSEPERLVSRFHVSHSMLLNVLMRPGGEGCVAMKGLLRGVQETPHARRNHARHAISLLRSLIGAGIVELTPDGAVVNADLQEDFSLHNALSLYAVEAIGTLDIDAVDYPLDVVTFVEATLEDPGAVLYKQVDLAKTRALAAMKAEGLEYDERMAELEKIDRPKPNLELLWGTFAAFQERHPWVGSDGLKPKSVARDMYEQGADFRQYVKEYGLQRSEGVLLRYLTDAFKALVQTVPEGAKTDALYDLTEWLGETVRQVDASLIEEWEKLRDPDAAASAPASLDEEPPEPERPDVTRNVKAFTVMVRNASWRLLRALAAKDYEAAAEQVEALPDEPAWDAARFAAAMAPYWEAHEALRLDPEARGTRHVTIERGAARWSLRQVLVDPAGDLDWRFEARVDLERSAEEGRPVLQLVLLSA